MVRSAPLPRAQAFLLLALLAVWLWPSTSAQAAERTFTAEYRAVNGCPKREQFIEEIRRRTALARLAGPGEQPEIAIRVRIDRKGKRFTGKLDITIGTTSTQRDLTDQSCAEVGSALALIAALAIDPLAETAEHLPPLPLPPDPHVPGEVGVRPAIPEPRLLEDPHYLGVGRAKVPIESEINLLLPRSLPAFPYVPRTREDRAFELGPGVDFALDIGPSPTPLAGFSGLVGVRSLSTLSWQLRAELTYSVSTSDSTSGGLANGDPVSFRMLRGRFEGCFPAWRATSWFRAWPCADLAGGAVYAELSRASAGAVADATSPWFALGAGGRVDFSPASWFDLSIRAGADFPLVRGSFKDELEREVFTPSPATFTLGAGGIVSF